MSYNIALDGPAGAGKSTIAKRVASELKFIYVDTGAMYRAMALYMLNENVDLSDTKAIAEKCKSAEIEIRYTDGVQCVFLNGENVNDKIRTPRVSDAASKTSVVKEVRVILVKLQQELAAKTDVVMDGRDIGSKVLPNAQLKIYMTASSRVRAERRYKELTEKGEKCELDQIEAEIKERDERDMNREESPLVQAEDAILLDTSDMTIDEVVEKIISLKETN
ncbi:MAG: (d)CMP kinase [Lachnospiraceae bacterium]|nr:(d)CMP kinase [Lachnospiraceae bacterium]